MAVTYEQMRDWVLALPGGEEVMVAEWGHPTLRVNGKMFASGAPDSPTATVKATKEEQAALLAGAPDVYSIAAYVGRFGWVQVRLAEADPDELHELVVEAWRRTAPKKLVKHYDAQ
ncbi:MmcQ/YjbR family DNA-binding protein [Catellatospora tritici]|uniref:MmcQ/YjbR family DNA-binding protein n=1 Tax=Catellatospora tritici TaxID=2851566 RepID=UPI001C2DE589|nr:MmcQ/YjbR family DNA-binding protein [Catellatospora tritici]MBV1852583.1 MmcQ/YjbR family DNA-binding protein [Catellatospora tritici]